MAKLRILLIFVFLGPIFYISNAKEAPIAEPIFFSTITWSKNISLQENYSVHIKTTKSVTIHSREGLYHGLIAIPYDKLNTIKKFEGHISNPKTGKIIRKLKLKDLIDKSYITDGSVFEDSRVKFFELESSVFPIKIDFSIETVSEGNFFLPSWSPAVFPNQKVNSALLEVNYPKNLGIRYKTQYIDIAPQKLQSAGNQILKWEIKDIEPLDKDTKSAELPLIKLAPDKFSMQGYQSTMESWNGLAKWQSQLNSGRDMLPAYLKEEIHHLMEGVNEPDDKIAVLYEYLQKNFRYVSIQLGIGGWMPATVEDVAAKKYGDCKGLTLLMQAMLKEVGISSNYTKVLAGRDKEDIDTEFPSNQFNHIILKVLREDNEPIWLECTSNYLPAGYLGNFTQNRHVLVVENDGGYLDKTPSYDQPLHNFSVYESYYTLEKNGNAKFQMKQELRGIAADDIFYLHQKGNSRDQKKYLMENVQLPGLEISEFLIQAKTQNFLPHADLTIKGISQQFYQSTAKRILIKPPFQIITLENISNNAMSMEEKITIETIDSIESESLFENISEEREHYNLQISFHAEKKLLTVYRKLEMKFDANVKEEDKKTTLIHINEVGHQVLLFKKSQQ